MGVLLCLLSAAGFGSIAIFGKEAYAAGVGVTTLLLVRFVLAAACFGALDLARRSRGRQPSPMPRRASLTAFALGAAGYAAQSGLFFGALQRMDASILSLLLYTYPALVTVAALVLGRERATSSRIGALACASLGTVLVLAGAASGHLDPLATAMAIAATLVYSAYILVADAIVADVDPLGLSMRVAIGATGTFAVVGVASGTIDLGFEAIGWLWLALIATVGTTGAVLCFFAGMRRVGASSAAILSTFEPVVTVALAFAVFGEALARVQLAGGGLVLAAVILLRRRPSSRPSRRGRARARAAALRAPA